MKGDTYCTLLLYKDARVDQRLLDEVVGPMNWQREHQVVNGNLYCTVSIYDQDKKVWVGKQDVGTESNTEKEKGEASDSFKRACFNWGIGRELYTAPDIFINLKSDDLNGNKLKTRFSVSSIEYDQDEISKLIIVDDRGEVRFTYPKNTTKTLAAAATKANAAPAKTSTPKITLEQAKAMMMLAGSKEDMMQVWFANKDHQSNPDFVAVKEAQKQKLGIK